MNNRTLMAAFVLGTLPTVIATAVRNAVHLFPVILSLFLVFFWREQVFAALGHVWFYQTKV
jgi:hypothetical protein